MPRHPALDLLPRVALRRRRVTLGATLFASSLLLGCPSEKPAPGASATATGSAPLSVASSASSATPLGASAIVHQPGTLPPAPSAHKASAPPSGAPQAPAAPPTFALIAKLDATRKVEAQASLSARWSNGGGTLGLPLEKELLVLDLAKASGYSITTHAPAKAFSLSRDEAQIAVLDASNRVTLWDTRKGTLLRTFPLGAEPLVLSPDGRTLAAGGEGLVAWDTQTGDELVHLLDTQVFEIVFSDDGKELLTANSVQVTIYDRSGKTLPGGGSADTGATFATTLAPNGRWAAASAPAGHGMQVMDVRSFKPRQLVEISSCEEHVWPHFSPNGRLLFAMGGSRWVKGFEVGSFKPYASYHATPGRELVAFADDLTRVVVTRGGKGAVLVVVETKAEIPLEKGFTEDAAYAFSADARYLSGEAGKVLKLWEAKTGKLLYEITG
jgi:hypothetical protein